MHLVTPVTGPTEIQPYVITYNEADNLDIDGIVEL